MTTIQIKPVDSAPDYQTAFCIMRELRPHLADAAAFTAQARRQAGQGYRILAAWLDGQILGLAGYRLQENLLYGRFLYIDDLVTARGSQRRGIGAMLIDALREQARNEGCTNFVLDTALENAFGQRFYFRQGLLAVGMHFRQPL